MVYFIEGVPLEISPKTSWIQTVPSRDYAMIPVISFIGSIILGLDDKARSLLQDQLHSTIIPPEIKTLSNSVGSNSQGGVPEAIDSGRKIAKQILDELQVIGENNYTEMTNFIHGIIHVMDIDNKQVLKARLEDENITRNSLPETLNGTMKRLTTQNQVDELKDRLKSIRDRNKLQELVDLIFTQAIKEGDTTLDVLKYISFADSSITQNIEPSEAARKQIIACLLRNPDSVKHQKTIEFVKATQDIIISSLD